ncbi:protein midgut expression 1 [Anastrepha obliqua]|uniref:protein midgut expression 1 n=1 Tax=Anastrepha ludens TaxID=28586 RepID=UPI0023B131DE|nr:protein midgut expression 1 [Anastrepha ludens]XP_054733417.1 protein midgut expression 1 [Anastrepha obliqua]
MCGALWECIKCPGKVVCCCCQCALKMVLGILCSLFGLIVVIGLIVYFTVFYHKNSSSDDQQKLLREAITAAPLTFKDYFQKQD